MDSFLKMGPSVLYIYDFFLSCPEKVLPRCQPKCELLEQLNLESAIQTTTTIDIVQYISRIKTQFDILRVPLKALCAEERESLTGVRKRVLLKQPQSP